MQERSELTEFSGAAGQILRRTLSLSSIVSGFTLAFVLVAGGYVLTQAKAPGAVAPFSQLIFALAVSRFALNGMFGEFGGTVFSTRGGSWAAVGMICARYVMLTAIWLAPLALLGPGQDEMAAMFLMGPAASRGLFGLFGIVIFGLIVTPPVFLIVATRSSAMLEPFSGSLWRATFAGRFGDLLVVYAVYIGGVMLACVLAMPVVLLGFAAGRGLGYFLMATTGCLALGVSANLLGRLCGFYACGECGHSDLTATDRPEAPAPSAPRGDAGQDVAAAPDAGTAVPVSADVSAPMAPALAVATASRLPPLMDAGPRVQELMRRFVKEPAVVVSALEELNDAYAPSPFVQQALTTTWNRTGRIDDAVALARTAFPLCLERGNVNLAAAVFREMRAHTAQLGASRDQVLQVAGMLCKMSDFSAAANAYTLVLSADPGDTRAIKGLLQVGDQLLEKLKKPDQAAKVFRYLLTHCSSSPLVEYMQQGLDEAERQMR